MNPEQKLSNNVQEKIITKESAQEVVPVEVVSEEEKKAKVEDKARFGNLLDRGNSEADNVRRIKKILELRKLSELYSNLTNIYSGEYQLANMVIKEINEIAPVIESNFDVFKKRASLIGTKEEFPDRMANIIKILEDIRDSKIHPSVDKEKIVPEDPYLVKLYNFRQEVQAIGWYLD